MRFWSRRSSRFGATHRRAGLSLILLFATLIKSVASWHVASRDSLKPSYDYGRRLRRESRTKADMRVTASRPIARARTYTHALAYVRQIVHRSFSHQWWSNR